MTLAEVAAVNGKPGLYRILKPTRTGVILESMDEARRKEVTSAQAKVSVLSEITMYTTSSEGSESLKEIFKRMYAKYPDGTGLTPKSEGAALLGLLGEVLPDFDGSRIYPSDIKKLVGWYEIIRRYDASIFNEAIEEAQ